MSSDRRYRQQGYRDSGGAPRGKGGPSPPPGPPGPAMLGQRSLSRCAECGTRLPAGIDALGGCPQCGTPLHACKQCTHFDPGRRFECAQPVAERVTEKTARNECAVFSLRVTVERDAAPGSPRPDEARRAFDGLFRKPSS